ncbi:hypothetical protein [Phytohabitans houttuyneae]|uniref:Uncharacterized protein n=1 Tax=Phytohabitans houttuyneae TaxID=1076126 RepID=A0A6V8K1V6_9ACTN|nr:hypothetical protein [Phytohabitans houttuyneae]GFJ79103.1 hypothetical protein Phou_032830 [Phytohabitans houttuyneae]
MTSPVAPWHPDPRTLDEVVTIFVAQGWRVETLTPTSVVLATGRGGPAVSRDFHLVNAIISVVTCGAWLPGWLILWAVLTLVNRPNLQRKMITVNESGQFSTFDIAANT